MSLVRRSLAAALVLGLAGTAGAQTVFPLILNGGQEVPPVASPHSGSGVAYFNHATKVLTYNFTITGLTGSFTAAHLHGAAPGVNGGVLFGLTGGPTTFSGSSAPLSAANEALLLSGQTYFNVHSASFPGGELRGQVTPSRNAMATVMNGNKEVPPIPTAGTAQGTLIINSNNTVTYNITYSGLSGPPTAAHIHDGAAGVNGGVIVGLTLSGPGTVSGTTAALSDQNIAKIRAGRTYVNIHTATFPGGEIRGQVVTAFADYGNSCPSSLGAATFGGTGVPAPGRSITLTVANGVPGQIGVLLYSPVGDDLAAGFGCRLYMNNPVFAISLPAMPGDGMFPLPVAIPGNAQTPVWLQLQYFGADPATTAGFYTTPGLTLHVNN